MAGLREFIGNIDDLQNYINTELPEYAKQVAVNDVATLVTNRVVQRGENYLGNPFSPYSDKDVAAWRFYGKSRTQAAEKKVRALTKKKGKKKGVLSSKGFRLLNNLKVDKKNFEFTSEMWRKFGLVNFSSVAGGTFKISLGGTTTAAQKKIDANSAQEGLSIIEANDNEKALANRAMLAWLEDQTERILNS